VRMGSGGSLNAHPRGWLPDPYPSRDDGRTRLEPPGTEVKPAGSHCVTDERSRQPSSQQNLSGPSCGWRGLDPRNPG
jgi:hypothetical protein